MRAVAAVRLDTARCVILREYSAGVNGQESAGFACGSVLVSVFGGAVCSNSRRSRS